MEAVVDIIGPDVLTLTIGSDIARGPNTPRPACRGYLHKRTQSGLIKGWRKRWFVLTHDCCLYYYRHKRVSREEVMKRTDSNREILISFWRDFMVITGWRQEAGTVSREDGRGWGGTRHFPWKTICVQVPPSVWYSSVLLLCHFQPGNEKVEWRENVLNNLHSECFCIQSVFMYFIVILWTSFYILYFSKSKRKMLI